MLDYIKNNKIRSLSKKIGQFKHNNKELVKFIEEYFPNDNMSTELKLILIHNGLDKIPTCPICGESVKIDKYRLSLTCGKKQCAVELQKKTYFEKTGYYNPGQNPDVQIKTRNTYFEKTGYYNPGQNPDVQLKTRNTYFEKTGYYNPSQNPDIQLKKSSTYFEKTGYYYPGENPDVQLKTRNTYFEKTGYYYPGENPDVQLKMRNTYFEKTGYYHPSQNPDIQLKKSSTYFEKTGYYNSGQNPDVQLKTRNTYFEKTGYYHPGQNPDVQLKMRNTYFEKTGYYHPGQNPDVQLKISNTYFEKTGYYHPSHNPEIREQSSNRYRQIRNENIRSNIPNIHVVYNTSFRYYFLCSECGITSSRSNSVFNIYIKNTVNPCPICNPQCSGGSSKLEKELLEYIRSIYSKEVIENDRTHRLEIDIYLPDLNLGIEFNGIYWHSEEHKDKYYHIDKTKHFALGDIHLVHVWEDEWINNNEEIKQRLKDLIEGKEINTDSLDWKKYDPSMIISEPQLIIREGHNTYNTGIVLDQL